MYNFMEGLNTIHANSAFQKANSLKYPKHNKEVIENKIFFWKITLNNPLKNYEYCSKKYRKKVQAFFLESISNKFQRNFQYIIHFSKQNMIFNRSIALHK